MKKNKDLTVKDIEDRIKLFHQIEEEKEFKLSPITEIINIKNYQKTQNNGKIERKE